MYFLYYFKLIHLWKEKRKWMFLYGIPFLIIVLTHQSFSGQSSGNTAIPVGVVMKEDSEENRNFVEILEKFNGEGERPFFHVTQCSLKNAVELLEADSIKGYVILGGGPKLVSKNRNSEIRVVKTFLDTYFNEETREMLVEGDSWYNKGKMKGENISKESIYDIALALACLLGGILAMKEVFHMEPYFSSSAVVYSIVPVSKEKLFFYNLLGAFSVHFLMVLALGIYIYQVCLIEGDMKLISVIPVLFFGSLMGFSLGAFLGIIWKVNEGIKKVVFIGICFIQILLSVFQRIHYKFLPSGFSVFENKLPSSWLIQSINQVNQEMVSVGIQKRLFFMAVTSLVSFAFIFWKIGRRQYDGF